MPRRCATAKGKISCDNKYKTRLHTNNRLTGLHCPSCPLTVCLKVQENKEITAERSVLHPQPNLGTSEEPSGQPSKEPSGDIKKCHKKHLKNHLKNIPHNSLKNLTKTPFYQKPESTVPIETLKASVCFKQSAFQVI